MTDRGKRTNPSLKQRYAAAILQLLQIPREHAKLMHIDQIIGLVNPDHDPVPYARARDLGWTPEQYNHPSNITIRAVPDHWVKTRTVDQPQLARDDRVSAEHQDFQRRLLAKSGRGATEEPAEKAPRSRGRKLQGQGFAKGHRPLKSGGFRGHRRFDGSVVLRGAKDPQTK